MIKVGLTGNFYSGQNEVSDIFSQLGVPVFDADIVLKYMILFSSKHKEIIQSNLGYDTYRMGLLDTYHFQTTKDWNKLLDLLEFDILKSYENFRLKYKDNYYTIFKYSYLFERKMNKSLDFTINCHRPSYLRKNDLPLLTHMDSYAISKLLNNEMDEFYKTEQADYKIENFTYNKDYNSSTKLESKVTEIHNKITKKSPQVNDLRTKYATGYWD